MSLWVPPRVSAEMEAERARHNAEVLAEVERVHSTLTEWNRILKRIDRHLELVRARDNATTPGLRPGYYHVLRRNPGAPVTFIVVEGPNGEFREPDSALLERLREGDLWSNRNLRRREEAALQHAAAKQRARERERLERVAETKERMDSLNRLSVVIPG